MARYKGTFEIPANYEPQKAAPFDARMLVGLKSDLTQSQTWQDSRGDAWVYVGMLVTVANDAVAENNGTYRLTALPYSSVENWVKQADQDDVKRLQEQIDNIEIGEGGSGIEVDTVEDLPREGKANTTYYVKENSGIYRWDVNKQEYISYGGMGEIPELNIQIIYGGTAHGTN